MPARRVVPESEIESFVLCRVNRGTWKHYPFAELAMSFARWAFTHAAKYPAGVTRKLLQDRLEYDWSEHRREVGDSIYKLERQRIPNVAARLAELFAEYQVVKPMTKYKLKLPAGHMRVEYAIAKSWHDDEAQFCVSLLRTKAPHYFRYPSMVALGRWLHARTMGEYAKVHLLHVAVLYGRPWIENPAATPVQQQLGALLDMMNSKYQFAIVGPHCADCTQHRCIDLVHTVRSVRSPANGT